MIDSGFRLFGDGGIQYPLCYCYTEFVKENFVHIFRREEREARRATYHKVLPLDGSSYLGNTRDSHS